MSTRLEVAWCRVCQQAISRLSDEQAWRHNYPTDEHLADPRPGSIRPLMAGKL